MVFDKDRTKQENTPTFRCAMIGHFADTQDPEKYNLYSKPSPNNYNIIER